MSVYILATLDTKGSEAGFVRDCLRGTGIDTQVVDTGCLGEPLLKADVSREAVFEAAGTTLAKVREKADRGHAIESAERGAAKLIADLHNKGTVEGVFGMGGSAGTTIATAAMRALPIGIPKLMVSTLASGQVRPYVGDKDILMLNSIVDISGINRISRLVLGNAAQAMAGMVTARKGPPPKTDDKPMVAATMFGVTTPCVEHARKILEEAGYEVLVFHATGTGGQAMETLISDGLIAGVLDITTTELADELVGGMLTAGPDRLTAAGRRGVPQVISVGATDMVNFGTPESVPDKFRDRKFYQHNPTVTLMRTTVDENQSIGKEIGRKAAQAKGPTTILLPLEGVSAIDCTAQPFDDPESRKALFQGVKENAGKVEVVSMSNHINDPAFAEAAAKRLIEMMKR